MTIKEKKNMKSYSKDHEDLITYYSQSFERGFHELLMLGGVF